MSAGYSIMTVNVTAKSIIAPMKVVANSRKLLPPLVSH